jgi:hypothetical protein
VITNCVVTPERASAKCTTPAGVDREWFSERLFCELPSFSAKFDCRVSVDAKVRGLLKDTIYVNALLFYRIH